MNSRQRKTLESIAAKQTPKNLLWNDIESLFKSAGCELVEGEGSRVSFRYTLRHEDRPDETAQGDFHRPHPGKEAKAYQVKKAAAFLKKSRIIAMKESTAEAYRGYIPIIWYSSEDGCFIGEVAGLDMHDISFEGETEEEIRRDFEQAVDFYLATTVKPEIPFSGRITLQMTPQMHMELFSKARSAGADSLDAWLVRELQTSVLHA